MTPSGVDAETLASM